MRLTTLFLRALFAAGLVLSLTAPVQAAQITAGKDYVEVKPPQPTDSAGKIEVLEFFWYGCPHCNNLQPSLEAWVKRKPADVEFKHVPAVFQDSWVPLTRAYYTIEAMGLVDKLHQEMFAALHKQRVNLKDANAIFDWAASKGVDRKKFADTYNSFGVNGRTQRSIELTRKFDIRFFEVVDALIAEQRKSKGSK